MRRPTKLGSPIPPLWASNTGERKPIESTAAGQADSIFGRGMRTLWLPTYIFCSDLAAGHRDLWSISSLENACIPVINQEVLRLQCASAAPSRNYLGRKCAESSAGGNFLGGIQAQNSITLTFFNTEALPTMIECGCAREDRKPI